MNYKIEATPKFERDVRKLFKKQKSLLADLLLFRELLKSDPTQGAALGKDCYKIRLAISSKGKGKRGRGLQRGDFVLEVPRTGNSSPVKVWYGTTYPSWRSGVRLRLI